MHSQRSSTSSRASIRQQELFNQLMLNTNNLQKNWKVDLANLLDEYLNEIEMSQICDEDILNTNFAEVALVVQNSAFIFSQKVKFFEQTVMDMHKSLSYKFMLRKQEMEKRKEAEHAAAQEKQNSSESQENNLQESECLKILKTQNEKPKKEKKKLEEKIEESLVQAVIPEMNIEIPVNEECDPTTLQNFLMPLFKKISRRIIDRDEDVNDDFYSKLPLFSNGLNSQLKYTCCQILANCLKPEQSLIQSLKDFFVTTQNNNNEDHQWDLKLLAAKMMLLTEIKNNVNISVKEAPAKILEYINGYLTVQTVEISASSVPESSVFYAEKCLQSDDFMCDSTDICTELSPSSNILEASFHKELRINVTRLSKLEICQYTRMSESELNEILDLSLNACNQTETNFFLNSIYDSISSSVQIKINIFEIPERLLKKRSLFKLPSDCITEEKKKRLAEKREERMSKRLKTLTEEPLRTVICDLEDFETFQREMLEKANANIQDFLSSSDNYGIDGSLNENLCTDFQSTEDIFDLRALNNEVDINMVVNETEFDLFVSSLNENSDNENDQLLSLTQADSGIGSTLADSICLSQAESNISQIDSDVTLCRSSSILNFSQDNNLLENNCFSTPLPDCSENIADSAIVSLFNTISDVTHSHEQREKSVQEWFQLIEPRLEYLESRNFFDVHDYESKILEHFPTTGIKTTIEFKDVVQEESPAEIARYFSTVLQMATDYKIDISQSSHEKLPMDCILLTNLTAERNYSDRKKNHMEISKNIFDKYRHFSFNNSLLEPESPSVFHYGPKKPPTGKKRPGQHMDIT